MMDGRYFADGALSCNWFDIVDPNVILSLSAVDIGRPKRLDDRKAIKAAFKDFGPVRNLADGKDVIFAKTEDARLDSHPENPEDEHTAPFIDHKISYYLNAVKAVSGRNLT